MIGAALTPVAIWLGDGRLEYALLIGSLTLVLITELLNSAIETVVDRVGTERNELSARAKDLGSAAVFVSLVNVTRRVGTGAVRIGATCTSTSDSSR